MFCSKCGKTLPSDSQRCPSCGQEVGESRFDGVPYTAAQFRISSDGTTGRSRDAKAYTKITYTDMQDPLKNEADSDARTSYRPVYEGSSVPEEIRGDVRRAMGVEEDVSPGEGTPSYGDSPESERVRELFGDAGEEQGLDDFDLSQLRSRPIVSEGRAGISRDVAEYVEKLENSEKGTRRGRRRAVYGAEEYDVPPQIDEPAGASYDEAPVDEAGDEPYARSRFPVRTVVKIVIAVLIIAALAMGVKLLYDNVTAIRKSASPIEGVSQTLYDEGVQLIEAHQNNEYTMSLLQKFSTDGLVAVTGQLAQDQAAVAALVPVEPAVNDELFLSVLTSIQENIGNAVTMDVLALSQTDTAAAQAESDARWQIVRDSIAQLKSAKTAAELTAILGGEKISIATPTPEPTATPQSYTPLSKGDKSNAVLDMQNRLWELGYLNDDRDGNFGSNTQTAVKWFQYQAGLDVTGVADSMTLTMLYSDDAPRTDKAQPTPTPTIAPTEAPNETSGEEQPAGGAPVDEPALQE